MSTDAKTIGPAAIIAAKLARISEISESDRREAREIIWALREEGFVIVRDASND